MDLKDKILLHSNIERCRELYNTGILFDGRKSPFVQSVFIEIMIRLRHLQHVFNKKADQHIIDIRDASAHPYFNREIEGTNIFVDFGRIFKGNWKLNINDKTLKKQDDNCDVEFQYGGTKISAKEILKIIEECEKYDIDKM